MRFLTHKTLLLTAIFACNLLLQALTFETQFILQEGGDLTAIVECAIPDKSAGILKEYAQKASADFSQGLLDEQAVRNHFQQEVLDAELKSYNVYIIPGGQRVCIEIFAQDARKFLASNALGLVNLVERPANGGTVFEIPLPKARLLDAQQEQQARELADLLGGVEIKVTLQTPKPLTASTGKCDDVCRCHWRITLDDIVKGNLPEIHAEW